MNQDQDQLPTPADPAPPEHPPPTATTDPLAYAQSIVDFLKQNLESDDPTRRALVATVVFLGAAGPIGVLYALVQTQLVLVFVGIAFILLGLVTLAYLAELFPNVSDDRRRRAFRVLVSGGVLAMLLLSLSHGALYEMYREAVFRYAYTMLSAGGDISSFVSTVPPLRQSQTIAESASLLDYTANGKQLRTSCGLAQTGSGSRIDDVTIVDSRLFLLCLTETDRLTLRGDLDLSRFPNREYVILAAKAIEIERDAQLTLAGRHLVVVTHDLRLSDNVTLRQFREQVVAEDEEGDGRDGQPAGNVAFFVLSEPGDSETGHLTIDVAGEDGHPGMRGRSGPDAPYAPLITAATAAVSVPIATTNEAEGKLLEEHLQRLEDPERRTLFRQLRDDCVERVRRPAKNDERPPWCEIRVCVGDASPGLNGRSGGSGEGGGPGGNAGSSGRAIVRTLASPSLFEQRITKGRELANSGMGGPGGLGGSPQAAGRGGAADPQGWCPPGISGEPGRSGARGDSGQRPKSPESEPHAFRIERFELRVYWFRQG